MMFRRRFAGVVVVAAALVCAGEPTHGAEQASPADVRRTLDEARQLLDDGKPGKAKVLLASACEQLASLADLERVPSGVRPLLDACARLKDDLDLEGLDVSGIEIPQVKASRPESAKPAANPAKPGARPTAGISFTKQVAPLLVTHCGGCHVTGRKGGFQMASYDALMKTGVVQRGVGDSSRLVEVIATGDMPRGGGKVAPQDLALLVAWINAGASFDGPDPAAPLGQAGGAPPAANAGMANRERDNTDAARIRRMARSFVGLRLGGTDTYTGHPPARECAGAGGCGRQRKAREVGGTSRAKLKRQPR